MLADRWSQILAEKADQPALWHPEGVLTFQDLHDQAKKWSPQLCERLGPYFLAQGDGFSIIRALLAGMIQGLPVQVVEKDRQRRVPTALPAQPVALIKQTVGSSGVRRCQFFSATQVLADVDRLHLALGLHEQSVALAPLSVAHSFGLTTTVLQTLLHGLPTHWLPTPFPSGIAEALAMHKRVFLPGVPAMWRAWLLAGLNLGRVSLAVCAGSPLTLDLESRLRETCQLKLHNLYGTSECGAISYDAEDAPRSSAADIGCLLPGVQAQMGPEGRLSVTSDAVGLGYDATLPGELFHPPEHLTWDRVRLDGQRLYWESCLGSGINVASRKLSPAEIAAKISAATGIAAVTVLGVPSRDPERVQDIVCRIGLPATELTQSFKAAACAAIAPWEVPRRWEVLCALP